MTVLAQAYNVTVYEISGQDFLSSARFDIAAIIPIDATKEQFRGMLQNLLVERFQLRLHHENRESPVYSLVVGKGGPRMKESPEEPAARAGALPAPLPIVDLDKMQRDEDGFPVIPGARGTYMMSNNGRMRMRAGQESMAQFVTMLMGQLGHPVTDATGLTGKYDFILTYAPLGMAGPGAVSSPSPDGAANISEMDSTPDLDHRSLNIYTIMSSSILYFQRNTTGAA